MNNEHLKNIRNALNDMYKKLNTVLYSDSGTKKAGLKELNPFDLVNQNFKYIVEQIEELDNKLRG